MLTQKGENTLADSEELVLDKFADNHLSGKHLEPL